jgi:hypothetical protein
VEVTLLGQPPHRVIRLMLLKPIALRSQGLTMQLVALPAYVAFFELAKK